LKIAVLSDIHANIWALESVWAKISQADRIYILGDMVGIGPTPREVIDLLRKDSRVHKVMGNHDHNTLFDTELGPTDIVPRRPHHEWMRSQLSQYQLEYLHSPFELELEGREALRFMHRHPADCGSKVPYFDSPFPEVLDDFYSDVPGDILFFGHTHIPLDITGRTGKKYVNPGAVGAQNNGLASFITMDTEIGRDSLLRVEAPYDKDAVMEELRSREVPYHRFIITHFF
jgi:putative phosphoesterase